MSEIIDSAINYHAYNVHEGEQLLSQVSGRICVLFPRGLLVAGFSNQGDLLMIRYSDYQKSLPVWILDFFEHRFIDEPLLAKPEQMVAGYIASQKSLVIPDSLYDEREALQWLKKIHFIESNEQTARYRMREDGASYLYAFPGTMKSLIGRYFPNAQILPLAAFQFYKPYKQEGFLQCSITPEEAYVTFYQNRLLQWHRVFSFENGEDIAYQLKLFAKYAEVNLDRIDFQCTVAHRGLNSVLKTLAQYFPNLSEGDHGPVEGQPWSGTIHFLQQLYSCGS